jgi:hypothetical protein
MNRKLTLLIAILALWVSLGQNANAVEAGEIAYINGTLGVPQNALGSFDLGPANALVFTLKPPQGAVSEVRIPYAQITHFEAYQQVTHHLGVLPAIGASLVRKRKRRHFLSLTYTDSAGHAQVVLFEVPKDDPPVLLSVLRARASQGCVGRCEEHSEPVAGLIR